MSNPSPALIALQRCGAELRTYVAARPGTAVDSDLQTRCEAAVAAATAELMNESLSPPDPGPSVRPITGEDLLLTVDLLTRALT